ncbi:peptide methionine sulfoxide reductase MsrB [Clostridium pasteurianum DSM 525 = ATCC 6013]|uniref:Peptide methionine sulfoxide reductase MsrB n=1 Tax=Clostridium pasteurianum DSM 525 = ATCC 6013 TaxID=1262449 RepID=A0A0H3J8A2_CLOPA|nr:peptide-methionine (R)-S-oxide reductase MsrB [Clostridium pasteurianum]AJA49684.1 peptide methionine sulfoxide reductase MsrB [Clostridium pasteurianum DSM 525 = ATCC 6013]AJA53672.1 peptide methionine sulfoxide reductase MsrB [Clostridium pasteurianum DSM 525 = ATCC 6013]ELP57626.1 bifunctional methionine sulfoxide reductase A/B [Clostridium pasteurianum DSM 525 = ATCC 6013]KRU14303.1 Peptide methionine sulfoxide reductase msrB [Clostridium pasteurianum DSM 525 = ATCC 6013]UZW13947.1 pept
MKKFSYIKNNTDLLRTKLTKLQYKVTQENFTEKAFENEYWNFYEDGLYVDVCSGEPLFTSRDKFDSGCGWPSFSKPVDMENIKENLDTSHGVIRTEVRSKYANSHLGHVFNDGPAKKGGLRYCINSASIKFIPKDKLKEEGYEEYMYFFD